MKKKSQVDRLIEWRRNNKELYEQLKINGLRKSAKAKAAAAKLSRLYSKKAQATRAKMPGYSPTESHYCAINWIFRSPDNVVYEFKNLANFVRNHPELFAPEDLIKKHNKCNAVNGLSSLKPYRRNGEPKKLVNGTWKGWSWVSGTEMRAHSN